MVEKTKLLYRDWLNVGLQKVAVFHLMLIIGYSIQNISYDASKVLTPEVVLWRWLASGALAIVAVLVWYLAHNQNNNVATYKRLLFMIITADIVFASFNVYTQRGMASRAVALYAVAIVASAILLNRAAIYTTAVLSSAAYILTGVAYFTLNFNEGYKAELYGEILFYSFMFIVIAGLLSSVVRFGGNTANN